MSAATTEARTEAEIWERTIRPEEADLAPETARFFLRLKLSQADHARLAELSAKARRGELTETESRELDRYLEMGWFLDTVRSKARRSLQRAA